MPITPRPIRPAHPARSPRPRAAAHALLAVLAAALGTLGCDRAPAGGTGPAEPVAASRTPVVVATTTMIADLARTLGGDAVTVIGIMKTGEDPHVYDVRPNDARVIASADLVLTNGLHLEATLAHVIEHNARGNVIALAESVTFNLIGTADPTKAAGAPDPHVWMDPTIWADIAGVAGDALIDLVEDPSQKQAIRDRTQRYIDELAQLDRQIHDAFAQVPAGQRVIITSHDAFAYFGRAYGVEVHGVIGISTEQQPRPQDIEALEQLVRDRNVKAVFIETSTSATLNQIVEKVARTTGVAVGGTLFSDSLGEPGTPGGTYLGMMRHNATTVADALRD